MPGHRQHPRGANRQTTTDTRQSRVHEAARGSPTLASPTLRESTGIYHQEDADMLALNGGAPVIPVGAIAPWPHITAEDRAAVLDVMDKSTPWRWPLEPVHALEAAWSDATGMPHVLAANSGTAALHMAVAAAGVGPGDEVIVPADTFLASASCVLQSNAIPIFVDTRFDTYNIDPERIAERVTTRTRAIIAVDLNGLPADYTELRTIADRYGLTLIEDAAQAQGAHYQGQAVGALGDMSGTSLNGSKCLSALGEGGLFAARDHQQYRLARRVMMFGEEIPKQGRDYNARIMGWNYRMDVFAAGFARSQLRRLAAMTEVRRANGAALTEALRAVDGIALPEVPANRTHVYFFYPILLRPEELGIDDIPIAAFRDAAARAISAEGLPISRWQHQAVPMQTLFQDMRGYGNGCPWNCGHASPGHSYRADDYPVAKEICLRRLVLGQSLSSFGPPNDLTTMALYAEALYKVLVDERDELVQLARSEASQRQ
jgi:perosamine synthetase